MTKEDTFKKPKAYNQTYMYLCSSLKDSYVRSDELIMAFRNGPYKVPIKSFIKELSRRTARGSLPAKFSILDGKDGSPTEARIIIRCPWGWTPERFQAEALRVWSENPSVEMVISCHAAKSVDMDPIFLTKDWQGKSNIRFTDVGNR